MLAILGVIHTDHWELEFDKVLYGSFTRWVEEGGGPDFVQVGGVKIWILVYIRG